MLSLHRTPATMTRADIAVRVIGAAVVAYLSSISFYVALDKVWTVEGGFDAIGEAIFVGLAQAGLTLLVRIALLAGLIYWLLPKGLRVVTVAAYVLATVIEVGVPFSDKSWLTAVILFLPYLMVPLAPMAKARLLLPYLPAVPLLPLALLPILVHQADAASERKWEAEYAARPSTTTTSMSDYDLADEEEEWYFSAPSSTSPSTYVPTTVGPQTLEEGLQSWQGTLALPNGSIQSPLADDGWRFYAYEGSLQDGGKNLVLNYRRPAPETLRGFESYTLYYYEETKAVGDDALRRNFSKGRVEVDGELDNSESIIVLKAMTPVTVKAMAAAIRTASAAP